MLGWLIGENRNVLSLGQSLNFLRLFGFGYFSSRLSSDPQNNVNVGPQKVEIKGVII